MAKAPVQNPMVQVGGISAELAKYMEKDDSLDILSQYQIVPRVKIIQDMTRDELKNAFGVGHVIITPGNAALGGEPDKEKKVGPAWKFVPLFFFVDWITWADINDTSNFMLGQTNDPKNPIAIKSKDKNTRMEPYANGKFKCKHQEHLNFVGFIYDGALKGTLAAISFAGGEYASGQSFISMIKLRRAPLWSNVFDANSVYRPRGTKKWWGIDMKNPADGQKQIKDEEIALFKSQHDELKKAYEAKKLGVSHEKDESDEGSHEEPSVAV